MARFIPVEKMKKLRESARSGDERAKHILQMQLKGDEDFSSLLDEYFAEPKKEEQPVVESSTEEIMDKVETEKVASGLEEFLKLNEIKKDSPDYEEFVNAYYEEHPEEKNIEHHQEHNEAPVVKETKDVLDKLMAEEMDAIRSYSEAIIEVMGCDKFSDNEKKGIISRLEEIKRDEAEHYDELKHLKENSIKKEEKAEEVVSE